MGTRLAGTFVAMWWLVHIHTQHTCVQYIPNPITGTTLGVTISGHNSCTLVPWPLHIAQSAVPQTKLCILDLRPRCCTLKTTNWMALLRMHTHTPTYISNNCQYVPLPLAACSVTFTTKHRPGQLFTCSLLEKQILPSHTVDYII